jgi:regulatory protein
MKKQKNAKDSALNLLARREHSRMELTQKLKLRNFSENEISQTIEQLTQQDLQSDKRFAECYMRSRAEKGFGPVRIKFELREKGVDEL